MKSQKDTRSIKNIWIIIPHNCLGYTKIMILKHQICLCIWKPIQNLLILSMYYSLIFLLIKDVLMHDLLIIILINQYFLYQGEIINNISRTFQGNMITISFALYSGISELEVRKFIYLLSFSNKQSNVLYIDFI